MKMKDLKKKVFASFQKTLDEAMPEDEVNNLIQITEAPSGARPRPLVTFDKEENIRIGWLEGKSHRAKDTDADDRFEE